MAELLIRGNIVLESHKLLEKPTGEQFEAYVLSVLELHGVDKKAFALCLVDYEQMQSTIDELEQLP